VPAKWVATREIPIGELERFPGNARRGNVGEIRKSIRRHGQYRALVVRSHDGHLTILAGNHTFDAMTAEGWDTGRAELIECSDDEARRINAADNRLGELPSPETGERYDSDALAELLAGLDGDYEGTGWTEDDLAELLAEDEPEPKLGRTDPDDAPEIPAKAQTKPGDLYRMGDHVLLCGDSTRREDTARLMDGEQACLMVTDPPYGVAFGNDKGKQSIAGDLSQAAIPLSFALAVEEVLDASARVYLFGGSGNWTMYAGLFDFHLRMQVRPIVWAKEHFVLRPNHYHSQFELVYYGWKGHGGAKDFWFGDRKCSDLWAVSRQEAETEKVHPTQKPVEVCAIPIRNSSPPGGLVYEPFGGSGSTLIAAHMLGRRARVMELDPKYCDVILRRFSRFAGITPELVHPDGTAEPVSFT
jgi:site-specific DNA-methyltransferase (adenine-specific)